MQTTYPSERKSALAYDGLYWMWGDGVKKSMNFYLELKVQKRQEDDPWYAALLEECREEYLSGK